MPVDINGLPFVSVIMPAYNAEAFLERALRSALVQTHSRLEIIVVDDGSRDRTADIARGCGDARVRCLSQPNSGQGRARNNGIRASAGRYVTFLDADDYYLPEKVARQVAFLEARSDCGAVFCDAAHFYSGAPSRVYVRRADVPDGDIFRALLRSSLVNPNTLMVRGDILRSGFFFREDRYYPEEWDLCLRLARAGVRFGHQQEDLVVVEIRENSNTTMDIQWILKRNALGMFEQLFAEMSDAERTAWGADRVLRRCKLNLAAAYLANGDKGGFRGIAAEALPGPRGWTARAVVAALPAPLLRAAAIRVWRWRQRRSFLRRPPLEEGTGSGAVAGAAQG
ncbi:MAG TPA: glycosyltransferase family A protein [bacterium]|nr:glycosyltransferase family A protein [bacterium]